MSNHIIHPTPYPDVNAVLHKLLSAVQAILGEQFVGLYLYVAKPPTSWGACSMTRGALMRRVMRL